MRPFTLERPRDLSPALAMGAQAGRNDVPSEYIAGGTDMVQLLQEDVRRPETLVSLAGLLDNHIAIRPQGLRLGAAATMAEVAAHPAVVEQFPWPMRSGRTASPHAQHAAGFLLRELRHRWRGQLVGPHGLVRVLYSAFLKSVPLRARGGSPRIGSPAVPAGAQYGCRVRRAQVSVLRRRGFGRPGAGSGERRSADVPDHPWQLYLAAGSEFVTPPEARENGDHNWPRIRQAGAPDRVRSVFVDGEAVVPQGKASPHCGPGSWGLGKVRRGSRP